MRLPLLLAVASQLGCSFLFSNSEGTPDAEPPRDAGVDASISARPISPPSLDFNSVQLGYSSVEVTFVYRAAGTDVVQTDVSSGDFTIMNDDCDGRRLEAGETCNLGVVFAPLTPLAKSAQLAIGNASADLDGVGEPDAGFHFVTPGVADFGDVMIGNQSPLMPLVVVNNTATPLNPPIVMASSPAFEVEDTCQEVIDPNGGGCQLDVVFRPNGPGVVVATVRVDASITSGGNLTAYASLGGRGVQ